MRWRGVAVVKIIWLARRNLFALLAILATLPSAIAENRNCAELRAQIAHAGKGQAERYRAIAAKQRAEYDRLSARAQALQCDRQPFLIFGEPSPPACAPINARLRTLYDSITRYENAGASGGSGAREALIARYDIECRDASQPRNFFEEVFGLSPPDQATGLREAPVEPPGNDSGALNEEAEERPMGGSQPICVRTCDGFYFPISAKARDSNLEDLETLCKALCPNVEAKLYTRAPWGSLEGALSIAGESYPELENAYKFQKTYDHACTCKPPDKSWAEALQDAELLLAERHKKDQMVTEEEAEKLSRPFAQNDPRLKKQKGAKASPPRDSTPQAPLAQDRTAAPAPEPSVVDGAGETYREAVGPDGVKRRVRDVAPSLQ